MNQYQQGAEFLLNYGLFLSLGIICTVLILSLAVGYLGWKCFLDVYNRDASEFKYKYLWISLFSISGFSIFIYGAGLFFTLLLSIVYIALYRPKLF